MSNWDTAWDQIREAVKVSRSVGEALQVVSKIRGFTVRWPALKAAWSRRESISAWNSLGTKLSHGDAAEDHLVFERPKAEETPLWYLDIKLAAEQVWGQLGAGYQETFYSTALGLALQQQGYQVNREVSLSIEYNRRVVGVARADLLVNDTQNYVVVEAKKVRTGLSLADENQCRAYIRALQKRGYANVFGFLVNFPPHAGELEMRMVASGEPLEK